jgi:hypothetical protein
VDYKYLLEGSLGSSDFIQEDAGDGNNGADPDTPSHDDGPMRIIIIAVRHRTQCDHTEHPDKLKTAWNKELNLVIVRMWRSMKITRIDDGMYFMRSKNERQGY